MSDSPSLAASLYSASAAIATVIAGRNLDVALAEVPAPNRPAVQDLAYGALREFGRGDFLLGRLIPAPLKEQQVRALLLATLYRLETRIEDAHTIVNQAVEAAGRIAAGRFKGLVNGVLRNYLRQREALAGAIAQDKVARWQHPRWWIARTEASFPDEWQQVLESGNVRPPMTLRTNRRWIAAKDYLEKLHTIGICAQALDDTAILLDTPQRTDRLPGFEEGLVSVQDWGAQRAASLLDAHGGMRVLDACSAPGGKAAHVLELSEVDLLALDADATRLKRVSDNCKRLGLKAAVTAADCRRTESWWDGHPFDRVLADVPCSASGVVRRHPDAKWLRRESDIAGFVATQAEILDALWQVLAPGGKMLYCTCSVFDDENEMQVAAFAARHPDAQRLPTGSQEHQLQLKPNDQHDGFFYALLSKHG